MMLQFENFKQINFIILEDEHFISSKFDIDLCTHGGDLLNQKLRTNRCRDSFSAFIW